MFAYPIHEEFQSDHLSGKPKALAQDFNHLAHTICEAIKNPEAKTDTLNQLLKVRDQAVTIAISDHDPSDQDDGQKELPEIFDEAMGAKDSFGWPSFAHVPSDIDREEGGVPILEQDL